MSEKTDSILSRILMVALGIASAWFSYVTFTHPADYFEYAGWVFALLGVCLIITGLFMKDRFRDFIYFLLNLI